jgi:HK97 family phage major capsid protein
MSGSTSSTSRETFLELDAGSAPTVRAPGYLVQTWGRAAVQTSMLLDAFEREPLSPGMVDVVGGVPTVKIPRLSSGPATAVQASDNAAVQEVDAISTSYSAPVASISGQQDMSRQLFEFSDPAMDEVITDALARDFGAKFDSELVNGTATSGHTRGLLNVASILR